MAYINDYVFDLALGYINTGGNRLDICSQEPTTYAQAITTYSLGNKTGISVGAPTDGSPNGRKVVVGAITDGSVTDTATASHWAVVDTGNSRLIATGQLAASQAVTAGNTFTLAAFDIGITDAV
jgi:hypothetical protein